MKVTDPNVIVQGSGLSSVELLENNEIKITLKNKSTLTFTPVVEEGEFVGYEMEYLTGQENRKIEKMKEKIRKLREEIQSVKEASEEEEDKEIKESEAETNIEE